MVHDALDLAGKGVDLADPVDLIAKEFHADGGIIGVRRENLHHVAAHAEFVTGKVDIIAVVLDFHQFFEHVVAALLHARAEGDDHIPVVDGIAQGVDARHTRNDDNVPPLGQGRGGGMAQLVDLVIDGGILLDIRVRGWDIRLRLIIIVVRDKIFHRILGENSRNSEQSWAASVLLCASTSVGRLSRAITFAMVNVLPEPVTPINVCSMSPAWTPLTRESIASG